MDPSPRVAGLGWKMLSITGTDQDFFKLVNSIVESTSPGPSLAELHQASSWFDICGSIFCDFNETRSKNYYFVIMKHFCRCSSVSVDEVLVVQVKHSVLALTGIRRIPIVSFLRSCKRGEGRNPQETYFLPKRAGNTIQVLLIYEISDITEAHEIVNECNEI
ncbi:hypothetical protein CQW23_32439 [Capsicum baccatum]|uniref:Uncharacterized protein n=1 Tax=Capsicum baccatum TaxID=33114 RepID=A0A2G2V4S9_CAPBA|nr:hypothetical protein CQW23_32439 [Capsicum baccatum]